MDTSELGYRRLRNQRLVGSSLKSAAAAVGWLGAVQSQDYTYAKWSVGQRVGGALRDREIDALVARGHIVRTHILRPTWHFVAANDLRWMMALAGPRVEARNRRRYEQVELDDRTLGRAREIIRGALAGGRRLTRPQLAEALIRDGIDASQPQRREYIVMHAELTLLICSGGLDAKQQTYALVDELVPVSESLPEDEALARLARRYFASHGPSTIADFAWWSGLRVSEARRGLEIARSDLDSFSVDGTTHWHAGEATDQHTADRPAASLLQSFDELIVGYQRTRTIPLDPNSFAHPIVADGRIVGRWRLARNRAGVEIDAHLDDYARRRMSAAQCSALDAEIERCRRFYGD